MKRSPALIEALADVRELRRVVLARQLFRGYSGYARIVGGILALLGACLLSRASLDAPRVHTFVWGGVCALAASINGTALLLWWRRQDRELEQLRPVLDIMAPFIVGGLLTFSLIGRGAYDLLFPSWMWLFGLMNISARHAMPRTFTYLGWYYIAAGVICLSLIPITAFNNPWPMGLVFLIGETVGGIALVQLRREEDL